MQQLKNFFTLDSGVRWIKVIFPFLAIVALMVGMLAFSMNILSSVRAFVGGESLWSKAQKEAVFHLNQYAITQTDADYQKVLQSLAVPLGDQMARTELDKPDPDLQLVRQAFIEGGNHPDDINGIISLYRNYKNFSLLQEPLSNWKIGDQLIQELSAEAERLHAAIAAGNPNPLTLAASLSRIREIDAQLTPLELRFSASLGESSREVQRLLLLATLTIAIALMIFGSWISRYILIKSDRFEKALKISEERLHLAMLGSNDGLWDWDIQADNIYYSPRLKELLGYALEDPEPTPLQFLNCIYPSDLDAVRAKLTAHLHDNSPCDIEFRVVTKAGELRWVRSCAQSTSNAAGKPVRMAGSFTDITARKRSEEQLYAAKERAQVTLESIGEAVITLSTDGLVEYLNPTAEILTRWTLASARGLPLEKILNVVGETSGKRIPDLIHQILDNNMPTDSPSNLLLVCNDGSEVAVNLSAEPIRNLSGETIGTVLVLHDVSKDREYAAQLSYQASHDELTGLINRREFERRLTVAMITSRDQQRQHAVLYLDLDQFKVVNDTCGHAAGDELIRQVSVLLKQRLRDTDTIARLGGDEFGVLLENCPVEHSLRIAEGLRQAVADFQFVWNNKPFTIGVSIGLINMAGEMHTLGQIMSAVDAACYLAKEKGRNRVHEYRLDDSELSIRHGEMEWITRINEALTHERFCLFSQEIVALGKPASHGAHFEILLRMLDKDDNLVLPMVFIPAAERYNLMPAIDRWVVSTVFATLAKMHEQGRGLEIQTCAINLSGTSIGDSNFLNFLLEQHVKYGIAPQIICFEITETSAIANFTKAAHFIQELRSVGYRFALDDFGAGMSSFAYLKNLPVDFIKIDGGFVKDMLNSPTDYAMVEAINKIGHLMGKKTIAEFAVNERTIGILTEIGVDFAQGYGIGRPRVFGIGTNKNLLKAG
ncbi:EAL domain-containing protein [Collimonas sp.]|jgi:diguanylate cyclase (GGDEF)-like protein/PAS domain S-box-containing protein|uniref:EAL domain-containing protein n=1 Tax=Collimonas sp. TaxID=1963772 RepID=UPI002B54B58F|nr:EAL domain-containing protein [Collimonas sp.]HWW07423.1 EAL domain-containing protein [Collimonas sp.]